MQLFTGTVDDFKRLATKGLVLEGRASRTTFYLFYLKGVYMYSRDSYSVRDCERICRAWDVFNDSTVKLHIYRSPTITLYRRQA